MEDIAKPVRGTMLTTSILTAKTSHFLNAYCQAPENDNNINFFSIDSQKS